MTSKIYLTLLMTSGLTLAIPTASSNSTSSTNSGPSSAQVTSQAAFSSGAGNNNADLSAGVAGSDSYTCYNGGWQNFPDNSKWVSFTDMFNSNKASMKSECSGVGTTADTDDQTGYVYNAILEVSKASLVDPRYILATVMQESFGCVNVGSTNNGETNPGIMQSANGTSFVGNSQSADEQQASVTQMVVDGTQGTAYGDGLVQGINMYGNIYEAARYYNSGAVDKSDLNNKMGATGSYVSDIANRMTGWVNANSKSCS